jgi:outer membrane lipoprotein carrier protein
MKDTMLLRRTFLSLGGALAALPHAWAQANGLALLEQFLQQVRSGRAQFTQVVTSLPRAGQAPRTRQSSGTLEFQRPGRFRFVYRKPFEQTLVADGQTLWLHDVDLNQVTARKQAQVLGSTPLGLILSATELAGLQGVFQLQTEAPRDGLQWVRATPRASDGQIQHALAGLRPGDKGPELAVLEVLDTLGQRSVLSFSAFEANAAIRPETFQFQVPAGADVVRP